MLAAVMAMHNPVPTAQPAPKDSPERAAQTADQESAAMATAPDPAPAPAPADSYSSGATVREFMGFSAIPAVSETLILLTAPLHPC